MRPARQGSLDGLCGVYAVINALDLVGVEAPRGARLHKDMFKQLTHGLGAVGVLAAMQDGIHAEDLEAAATLAFSWLHATWGFELAVSRPLASARVRSAVTFTRALQGWLAKPETAVVISYERAHGAHWTVAREVTRTELLLRDSDGVGALRLADFRRQGTSWRFRAADTLLIQRVS